MQPGMEQKCSSDRMRKPQFSHGLFVCCLFEAVLTQSGTKPWEQRPEMDSIVRAPQPPLSGRWLQGDGGWCISPSGRLRQRLGDDTGDVPSLGLGCGFVVSRDRLWQVGQWLTDIQGAVSAMVRAGRRGSFFFSFLASVEWVWLRDCRLCCRRSGGHRL